MSEEEFRKICERTVKEQMQKEIMENLDSGLIANYIIGLENKNKELLNENTRLKKQLATFLSTNSID